VDVDLSGLRTHDDPRGWWRQHLADRAGVVVPLLERLTA